MALGCAHTTPPPGTGGTAAVYKAAPLRSPEFSVLPRRAGSEGEKVPGDGLCAAGPSDSEWLTSFCFRRRNRSQRQETTGVTIGHPFSENNFFQINYLFTFPVHLASKLSRRDRVRDFSQQPNRSGLLRIWAMDRRSTPAVLTDRRPQVNPKPSPSPPYTEQD